MRERWYRGLILVAVICWLGKANAWAQNAAHQFIWEQANAQAATAVNPQDFLAAAQAYNRLINDGVVTAPLLLNLGSALLLAGDGHNAGAAFQRAERLMGATPESRQGLQAALALREGSSQAELPWFRTAFFWHFNMPLALRLKVALGGWLLLWLGVPGCLFWRRRARGLWGRSLSEALVVSGVLLTLVFGASATVSLVDESHDRATWGEREFTCLTDDAEEVS